MDFYIMTLFPDMVMSGLNTSITGRAIQKSLLRVEAVNIRDYAFNKHSSVDDYPYGGGAGMLMQAEPVYQCYHALEERIGKRPRVIFLSPQGETFHQEMAEELAQEEELVFLCGHYEGIDERVLEEIVTDYVSIGDCHDHGGCHLPPGAGGAPQRCVRGIRKLPGSSAGISPVFPAGDLAWETGAGSAVVRPSREY